MNPARAAARSEPYGVAKKTQIAICGIEIFNVGDKRFSGL
jgi:hypothetical protein